MQAACSRQRRHLLNETYNKRSVLYYHRYHRLPRRRVSCLVPHGGLCLISLTGGRYVASWLPSQKIARHHEGLPLRRGGSLGGGDSLAFSEWRLQSKRVGTASRVARISLGWWALIVQCDYSCRESLGEVGVGRRVIFSTANSCVATPRVSDYSRQMP